MQEESDAKYADQMDIVFYTCHGSIFRFYPSARHNSADLLTPHFSKRLHQRASGRVTAMIRFVRRPRSPI